MYCKKCGTEITGEARFCKKCGYDLLSSETIDNNQSNPDRFLDSSANTDDKKNSKIKVIVIVVAIALVLGVACIYTLMNNDIEERVNNDQIELEEVSEVVESDIPMEENQDNEVENASANEKDIQDTSLKEIERLSNKENRDNLKKIPENKTSQDAFYGIWIAAFKTLSEAQDAAEKAKKDDINGKVFVSSEWSNLNTETMYVVSAGVFYDEQEAEDYLDKVLEKYPDAYIKFSGNYIDSLNSNFIIPFSDSRYITEEDIAELSADELRMARNEIVARHGRKFKDSALQEYFNSKEWYEGTIEAEDFLETEHLNDYELKNMYFISDYETIHNVQ